MIVGATSVKINDSKKSVDVISNFLGLEHNPNPTGIKTASLVYSILGKVFNRFVDNSSKEILGEDALKIFLAKKLNVLCADGAIANQSENVGVKSEFSKWFPSSKFEWCFGHKSSLMIKHLKNNFPMFSILEDLVADVTNFFDTELRWDSFLCF